MTYGGIYRDVYLDVKEKAYISDVFVSTKLAERYEDENAVRRCKRSRITSDIEVTGADPGMIIRQSVSEGADYRVIGEYELDPVDTKASAYKVRLHFNTGDVQLWDVDAPKLYRLKTELIKGETVLDESIVSSVNQGVCV